MKDAAPEREPIPVLSAAALFSFTLLFFAPLVLYYANATEFGFVAPEIIPRLAALACACAGLLTLVARVLPPSPRRVAVSLLIALSYLLWIEGNVLVWDYGVLNGMDIPWESHRARGLIDGAVWVAACAAAVAGFRPVSRNTRRLVAILFAVQILGLLHLILRAPEEPDFKRYEVDDDALFHFSPERNVIIAVVDSFQADAFQRILDEDASLETTFSGFTFFRNALGGYPETQLSIPNVLTGEDVDYTVPYQDFIRKVYSHSLPSVLTRRGYSFQIQSCYESGLDVRLASNVTVRRQAAPVDAPSIARLYDVTLLRYLPTCAKRYVWRGSQGMLEMGLSRWGKKGGSSGGTPNQDLRLVENMELSANAESTVRTFKYLRFQGVHPPFEFNENCAYEPMPTNGDSYIRQARGELRLMGRFLGVLKRIGVYDSSLIIIMGDHGVRFPLTPPYLLDRCSSPEDPRRGDLPSRHIMSRGWPLLLVKPPSPPIKRHMILWRWLRLLVKSPSSSMKMRVSDAPVCLSDIPMTVASTLGIDASFQGRSVFDVQETEARTRRYYHWLRHDVARNGFARAVKENIVEGLVWCPETWRSDGILLVPGKGRVGPLPRRPKSSRGRGTEENPIAQLFSGS